MEEKPTSEFGKGFIYCLALWCTHLNNETASNIGKLKFLIDKSPEELDKIINKTDPKHNYGKDMDTAIFYMTKILPIYKTKEKLLAAQIEVWANGASDHLYELTVPPQFIGTEIEQKTEALKTLGLHIGHGFPEKSTTWEDFIKLKTLTSEVVKLVDKALGVEVINPQWGEL